MQTQDIHIASAKRAAPTTAAKAAIVLFGQDARGKAHASVFCEDEMFSAQKAASLMGFSCWRASSEHRELVAKLPKGRIFPSGRAFVPFVSTKAFDRLEAASGKQGRTVGLAIATRGAPHAAGATALKKATSSPTSSVQVAAAGSSAPKPPASTGGGPTLPADWATIVAGDLVLATTGDVADGWFECRVIAIVSNGMLELEWRDFPDEVRIVRSLEQVALMHPNSLPA